jgi:hypothetical protein
MSQDVFISLVAGVTGVLVVLAVVAIPLAAIFYVRFETRANLAPQRREEAPKKKTFLVPGQGIFSLHEKRKVHYIDEQKEWAKEQNEAQ